MHRSRLFGRRFGDGSIPAWTLAAATAGGLLLAPAGCGPTPIDDPVAVLRDPAARDARLARAIELSRADETAPERLEALHAMLVAPGYSIDAREAALNELARVDLANLKTTVRRTLPRTTDWGWLTRASEIIAERGWADLAPALISSWARPALLAEDFERPEYHALVALFGEDRVVDVLFETVREARSVAEQGLRTRAWTLLNRLGHRDRLTALLAGADVPADDAMLLDLKAAAEDLAIVPSNREEILWIRKLREPARAAFWADAKAAVAALPAERRAEIALKDLGILVAAVEHDPALLRATREDLYRRAEARLEGRDVVHRGRVGDSRHHSQALRSHREKLTWGDLAAILVALEAMDVPEVRAHLFRYAERDMADESTEYGGIIRLDGKDRFEVLEFPPRVRFADTRFVASQDMFDAGYDGVFHFHHHAQKYRNDENAGPGYGDLTYADETRVNALVFTFLSEDEMNVDFYRHDDVIVDLGTITRPAEAAARAGGGGA